MITQKLLPRSGPFLAVHYVRLSHTITCPFPKYFKILYISAQIFKSFALFNIFWLFFCPFSENCTHALTFKNTPRCYTTAIDPQSKGINWTIDQHESNNSVRLKYVIAIFGKHCPRDRFVSCDSLILPEKPWAFCCLSFIMPTQNELTKTGTYIQKERFENFCFYWWNF